MRLQNERAVSPVVGVMLMLIVVIIIAAIVSGFAGNLVSSNNKAPQANIQGTYSASAGILQMYHAGGDELSTQKIFVTMRLKDEENGGFSGTMSRSSTNKSNICNAAGTCWLDAMTGMVDLPVWTPGQTMYYTGLTGTGMTTATGLTPNDVGKTFTLEIDTIDGKLVSRNDVKIGP
ncbi:type IV pilin N-terminal domain-containing protein [Methanoregula sp.]|jgi:archaeal type IV pilus assembly protein PilA|uniref:type IV pilin N-terminal domain-containing protein n=1 Tax=Methanoregula sp. TaxID=2052170 RepID=UPI003C1E6FEA